MIPYQTNNVGQKVTNVLSDDKNYVRRKSCPRKLASSGCFTGHK